MRLKDKVAIITGAGNGIGEATAYKFAQEGAKLALCDVNQQAVDKVVTLIKTQGGEAQAWQMDVTNRPQITEVIEQIKAAYGRIDVLVNNAGIVADAQLHKMTDEAFDRVIDIDLKGVYNCTRAVVNTMIAQKSGVILNAASVVGLYGNFGQTNYAAAKFGLIGFVKTWAKELGKHGIRANAVCPGFVSTTILHAMPENVIQAMRERVPLRRLGNPEEIANVYAFLASDEASYINGAAIEVSGGLTL
jgi:3-oxoacyl-[acyl-carrier protein] reductase